MNNAHTTAVFYTADLGEAIMENIIAGMDIQTATAQAYLDVDNKLSQMVEEARQAKNNGTGTKEVWDLISDESMNHRMAMISKYGEEAVISAKVSAKNVRAGVLMGTYTLRPAIAAKKNPGNND